MTTLISTFSNGASVRQCMGELKPVKTILLTSSKYLEDARNTLKGKKGEVIEINPFESTETILKVVHLCESEKDPVINMTEGTNAMAATALTAAFYAGVETKYVTKQGIRNIPIVNMKPNKEIPEAAQKLLYRIYEIHKQTGQVTQRELAQGAPAQVLTRPLALLKNHELITKTKEQRHNIIELTNRGVLLAEMRVQR